MCEHVILKIPSGGFKNNNDVKWWKRQGKMR